MPPRLLLADDSITIQRVIELTFADENVTVTAVGDGTAAIARLEAEPPDILLADIGMPGKNGYEVAAYVQQTPALAHIPVLLLTGASEPADEARVRALGVAGVLVKPFEPQMVIARVRELLRGERGGAAATAVEDATPPAVERREPSRDADEYFAQLDAAFANLSVVPDAAASRPAEAPAHDAAPAPQRAAGPTSITMAGAFEALLGAEQGEPLPALTTGAMTAHQQEAIVRREAADAAERIVREIAPEIVLQVAERLVKHEIDRLRAEAASETSSPERS